MLINVHFTNAKVRDRKKRLSNLKAFHAVALLMRSEMQASEENKDPFYVALYIMLFSSSPEDIYLNKNPHDCVYTNPTFHLKHTFSIFF